MWRLLPGKDVFEQMLHDYLKEQRGVDLKVPLIKGKPVDLHHLFLLVLSHGGFHRVTRSRNWTQVWRKLACFDKGVPDASLQCRRIYQSLLLDFELHHVHLLLDQYVSQIDAGVNVVPSKKRKRGGVGPHTRRIRLNSQETSTSL